jgi:hypothetical protein
VKEWDSKENWVVPLRKGQRKIANHWMSMAAKHPEMDHYSLPFMK